MDRLSERSTPHDTIGDMQDYPPKTEEVWEEVTHDAVFGEISEEGPNYRNVCLCKAHMCVKNWQN